MVDEGSSFNMAYVKGLFVRIEGEVGAKCVRHPPAHDAPRIGVDDEGGVKARLSVPASVPLN